MARTIFDMPENFPALMELLEENLPDAAHQKRVERWQRDGFPSAMAC